MPDHQVEYVDLPIYHDELAGALRFSPSDLQANRAGRLTDSQRVTQFKTISQAIVISAVCLALAIGCLVLAFAIGVTTGLGVLIVVLTGCFSAFVILVAWFNIPFWRDLQAGIVSNVDGFVQPAEGEAWIRTGPGAGAPIWSFYWVVDNTQRFWVTGNAYAVLTPARHRLYFLPLTRRIVAAEPISTTTT
jgi:hypothetical protein